MMWDLGRFVLWSLKERDVGVVLLTAMVLRHSLRFRKENMRDVWVCATPKQIARSSEWVGVSSCNPGICSTGNDQPQFYGTRGTPFF